MKKTIPLILIAQLSIVSCKKETVSDAPSQDTEAVSLDSSASDASKDTSLPDVANRMKQLKLDAPAIR